MASVSVNYMYIVVAAKVMCTVWNVVYSVLTFLYEARRVMVLCSLSFTLLSNNNYLYFIVFSSITKSYNFHVTTKCRRRSLTLSTAEWPLSPWITCTLLWQQRSCVLYGMSWLYNRSYDGLKSPSSLFILPILSCVGNIIGTTPTLCGDMEIIGLSNARKNDEIT
jgi:hypothetical protein